jgi:hypothetical protein
VVISVVLEPALGVLDTQVAQGVIVGSTIPWFYFKFKTPFYANQNMMAEDFSQFFFFFSTIPVPSPTPDL